MAKITKDDISRCYELGVEFAKDNSPFGELVDEAYEHGMNRASASDYIRNVKYMVEGTTYKRTISADATQYYLDKIRSDFGSNGLANALHALETHIEYYEELQSVTLHKQREILEQFQSMIENAGQTDEFDYEDFDDRVRKALTDDASSRQSRIAYADPKPKVFLARRRIFSRNADVAAEVLIRAKGHCENCGAAAPFVRAKDYTPYLEVHHRIPLAEDGDDTLENAVALCPNCHREAHLGVNAGDYRT